MDFGLTLRQVAEKLPRWVSPQRMATSCQAPPVGEPLAGPLLPPPALLASSERAAVDRLRPGCVMMAGGSYADELIPLYGLSREEVARLREALRTEGIQGAAQAVSDNLVEAFCLVGSPEEYRDRIAEMKVFGVTQVIVGPGVGKRSDEAEAFIRTFSWEIIRHA